MPIITFEGGKLSRDQKRDIIAAFTKTASAITAIPEREFVIMLKENDVDNIGVGGKLLSDRVK